MFQASLTSLNSNGGVLKDGVAPFDDEADSAIDKYNVPQQASIFYGGKIINHLGAFAQLTYDGPGNDIALDNTDIRYSRTFNLWGKHLTYGFTINNSPTVEDLWNSTPAFGFPYGTSEVAPGSSASPLIDGGLAQQLGGIGGYASWNNLIYGAFSLYRTTNDGITRPLGAGAAPDTVTDGAVPYWRLALQHQWGKHAAEVGTYGIKADVYPGGLDSGPTDRFKDYAFDAQYDYIGPPNVFSLHTTWIHEKQSWDASFDSGDAANRSDTLKTFKVNANYSYRADFGIIGGSVGYFSTTGDTDTALYGPDPVDGSRTGSPDTRGFILEGDYVFMEKYKFSLQYILYDKFNGADSNYDGSGRDASDNNTFYLLAWLMF